MGNAMAIGARRQPTAVSPAETIAMAFATGNGHSRTVAATSWRRLSSVALGTAGLRRFTTMERATKESTRKARCMALDSTHMPTAIGTRVSSCAGSGTGMACTVSQTVTVTRAIIMRVDGMVRFFGVFHGMFYRRFYRICCRRFDRIFFRRFEGSVEGSSECSIECLIEGKGLCRYITGDLHEGSYEKDQRHGCVRACVCAYVRACARLRVRGRGL